MISTTFSLSFINILLLFLVQSVYIFNKVLYMYDIDPYFEPTQYLNSYRIF